ncbi:hypothetical protein BDK92_7171 [Micromonospora pisi]|uniref:Uncharacterized protein n=1 Tax=Micromonospora pisi TaxID=589240 RepID=A0A495JUM5_9ACTN|nr:hypothetical protein [Micromonospora pisi]RKR92693.1 hypothetical protein BDK92_7171 [Micromonospora pisi]
MSNSFADQHAAWQEQTAVARQTGTEADRAEAERLRQEVVASPAVQRARKATDARPVRS